jgi:hypothetical protein
MTAVPPVGSAPAAPRRQQQRVQIQLCCDADIHTAIRDANRWLTEISNDARIVVNDIHYVQHGDTFYVLIGHSVLS